MATTIRGLRGGGVNKLRLSDTAITGNSSGVDYSYDPTTEKITLSGTNTNASSHVLRFFTTSTSGFSIPSFTVGETYTLSVMLPSTMYCQFVYKDANNTSRSLGYILGTNSFAHVAFTVPSNYATFESFQVYITGSATTLNTTVYFELSEGSTAPTAWTPYSNICPISGWTEATVTRTGENIAPSDKWQVGTLTNSGQTTTVPYAQRTLFLPCEPNTSYILKISEEKNIRLFGYETNQSNPQATTFGTAVLGKEASIITGANDVFIRACVWDTDTSVTLNFSDFSPVVLAKDVQVYTIPIGQTVYGGTLDVTSGKLTVDRAMQDLGALSYTYTDGSAQFRSTTALDNVLSPVDSNADVHAISSLYRVGKYADLASNDFYLTIVFQGSFAAGQVWLKNSNYSDPNVFKTAMSGVQLCYELATPIEVDLTPTEITTLLGTNNIFADCGDTTVNYYADTTLFVNKKIAAAVAALS